MTQPALDQALLLARSPGLARRFRSAPLPDGMLQVLRIAAGDEESINAAVTATARSVKSLQEATAFYIVQILLNPGNDNYRTLGTNAGASRDELRSHMVWLLKWLHPDTHKGEQQTVFATRVTRAWESLRTAESRTQYDTVRTEPMKPVFAGVTSFRRRPPYPLHRPARHRSLGSETSRRWRRLAVPVLLGGLIVSCVAVGLVYLATFLQGTAELGGRPPVSVEAEAGLRH